VYRRRRLVALLLVVTVVAALALAVSALWPSGRAASNGSPLTPAGASAVSAARPIATDVYVVRSGDTLWSIARSLQPTGDVRPIVDRLAAGRHGAPLQPGERIALP
jgi:Tfp pilus assembly protein FimV